MKRLIGVIGAGIADDELCERAREVGRLLAEHDCTLVTGGLRGVMEAASQGAAEAGGTVVGSVPGPDPSAANAYAQIVVATGLGDARNAVIANTASGFIAVGGSHGTLSEIAFALKREKPVVALGSCDVDPAVQQAAAPADAVARLLRALA